MLIIRNNGLFYSDFGSDANDVRIISDAKFLHYLSDDVEFASDLTFGRLFDLIIQHKDTINIIFSKAMGNYKIEQFIEDFEGEATKEKDFYLTISTVPDFYDNELNIYHSFGGYNETEKIGYSVGFSKLSELKDLTIKIEKDFDITELCDEGKLKNILKAKVSNIQLFDVIQAILHEITFYGDPKHRQEVSDELVRRSDEIDEAVKNGTLDQITKPWEEVKIGFEKQLLEQYIKEENFEEAAKIQKKIDKLFEKLNKKK